MDKYRYIITILASFPFVLFVLFYLVLYIPVEFEDEEDVEGEVVVFEPDEFDVEEFEDEEERST